MKASESKKMQKRERVEIVHLPPSYTDPAPEVIEQPVTISEGSRGRRGRRQKQLDLEDQLDIE